MFYRGAREEDCMCDNAIVSCKIPKEDKSMKIYFDDKTKELKAIVCNKCKKEISVRNGMIMEGCFHGSVRFGYFSRKDGTEHSFDLCEECYDKLIEGFAIPVKEEETTELL